MADGLALGPLALVVVARGRGDGRRDRDRRGFGRLIVSAVNFERTRGFFF